MDNSAAGRCSLVFFSVYCCASVSDEGFCRNAVAFRSFWPRGVDKFLFAQGADGFPYRFTGPTSPLHEGSVGQDHGSVRLVPAHRLAKEDK